MLHVERVSGGWCLLETGHCVWRLELCCCGGRRGEGVVCCLATLWYCFSLLTMANIYFLDNIAGWKSQWMMPAGDWTWCVTARALLLWRAARRRSGCSTLTTAPTPTADTPLPPPPLPSLTRGRGTRGPTVRSRVNPVVVRFSWRYAHMMTVGP